MRKINSKKNKFKSIAYNYILQQMSGIRECGAKKQGLNLEMVIIISV